MRTPDRGDAPAGGDPPPDTGAHGAAASRHDAQGFAAPPLRHRSARRTWLRVLLLVVVPAVAVAAGVGAWLRGGGVAETDNAYVKTDKLPVSAEVAGTVRLVMVAENQSVVAGQPLFRLDDAPFRVALARADARVAQARTDVAALRAAYRARQAEVALARTRHAFAEREQQRTADLAARQFISASRLDEARQVTDLAAQQVIAVEQDLRRIAETLGGGPDVPADRHPAVLAAHAELMQARLDLARVEVRAPLAGTVSRTPKPGQYLAAGATALALVAGGTPWIEANFTETDLTWIRVDQPATVRIDTYPGRVWRGAVDSLSPATGAEFSVIPAQNASGNWVKIAQRVPVRIRLDPDPDMPALRAGLSAHVTVATGHRRTLAGLLP